MCVCVLEESFSEINKYRIARKVICISSSMCVAGPNIYSRNIEIYSKGTLSKFKLIAKELLSVQTQELQDNYVD